jgi:hypothetical protein
MMICHFWLLLKRPKGRKHPQLVEEALRGMPTLLWDFNDLRDLSRCYRHPLDGEDRYLTSRVEALVLWLRLPVSLPRHGA